ncbi:hypothetical protein, partial [Paraburkholderia sp. RL17-373-BIF-A]|uniref:hypothetical protein n=1 Tax=Paraburkholderia sp. RL17-373-BIF-A TaxID=3031629 RepID=UPI0038BCC899
MSDLNYGDTFHLKVWGVGMGPTSGARGYLALDESGALTTTDPEASWKFESPIGKTGVVEVLDIVNIVYAGPNQKYQSCYLQGAAEATTPSITAVSDDGKSDKNLQWDIALQTNQSGPVTDDQYIMLSCCSHPVNIAGGNATGAFLVDEGSAAGNRVGTRQIGNAGVGADTWWQLCGLTPSPAP